MRISRIGPSMVGAASAVIVLAACGGSGGNGSYGQASLSATGCQSQMSVGDQMESTVEVTNQSNARWPATVIWLDGVGDFVRNSMTDDTGADGVAEGAGQYNFSALDPGQRERSRST